MNFILNSIYTIKWLFSGESFYTRAEWVDSFVTGDGATVLVFQRVGKLKEDGSPIYYYFTDAELTSQVCAPSTIKEYSV